MFLAIRDLWWARGRFAVMTGAIALITLLVVMLSGLTAGLGRQSTAAISTLHADRVAIEQPSGQSPSMATSRVSSAVLASARRQPGVRTAEPIGITTGRVAMGNVPVAATVFGVDPGSQAAPSGLREGTAVVGPDLAPSVRVGDTVTVGGARLRIVGIDPDASFSHLPVVWVPRSLWLETGGSTIGAGSVLALRTGPGFDAGSFERATGLTAPTRSDALSAIGSYAAENGSLTMIRALLIAISALVIGAFFTVWTVQREGDLAVLKAIGARTAYLVKDALGQALLTLLIGGGVGTLAALALGAVARGSVPLVIDVSTVAVPFLLMIVVGLVGAAAALRRVVTVDPMTALAGVR